MKTALVKTDFLTAKQAPDIQKYFSLNLFILVYTAYKNKLHKSSLNIKNDWLLFNNDSYCCIPAIAIFLLSNKDKILLKIGLTNLTSGFIIRIIGAFATSTPKLLPCP